LQRYEEPHLYHRGAQGIPGKINTEKINTGKINTEKIKRGVPTVVRTYG
jgi:hypothetical protein